MEAFVGSILALPYDYVLRGWALCNGQLLQIQQNSALYALLGTRFGGDGKATFALPKLAPLAPNINYCICLEGIWPSRN